MAILEKDLKRIESLASKFNVPEFFGLFACIITGRSWEAIGKGIDKVKFSPQEVSFIRSVCLMMNQNKYIFWFKLGVGNQSRGFKIPS